MRPNSMTAFFLCSLFIVVAAFCYYPKWQQRYTEATLSWDVSGYYMYLPAIFIYKDLKELNFRDDIIQKYKPSPEFGQAFRHPSGNFVMKYSCGQALQYLPWFTIGHLLAKPLGYPADGFSKPYQVAIGWGSLLVVLLGLWFLRKNLLYYFSEKATAITLLLLVFGSNYLNYSAFDGAMTHNWLFTLYCLLIYSSIRFYQKPSYSWAIFTGILIGWAALTRPTEIIVGHWFLG
jgi:Dolichyl-phosphate-mannose-protein mannosyltransferase